MRTRKLAFGVVAFVLPSLLLVLAAEVAVRWRVTGGLLAAIQSFAPTQAAPTSWLIADPDLGYRLNPSTPGTNSLGIRHGELAPARDGEKRLLVLGDSVAWDEEGFVAVLGDRLSSTAGIEVVNAAIPGYTTHQERILFERHLAPTEPDFVIVQYCVNDNHRFLHRLDEGGHWIIVPEVVEREGVLRLLPDWLEASYIVQRILWRIRASDRAELAQSDPFPWRDTPEFGNAWRDETWPAQEAELRGLVDAAARVGARIAIVAVPYEPQLAAAALERDREYALKPQRALAAIAARLDVPFLDLHPAFLAAEGASLYRDQIHLTEAGHALAADEIEAFLRRERWLDESS